MMPRRAPAMGADELLVLLGELQFRRRQCGAAGVGDGQKPIPLFVACHREQTEALKDVHRASPCRRVDAEASAGAGGRALAADADEVPKHAEPVRVFENPVGMDWSPAHAKAPQKETC